MPTADDLCQPIEGGENMVWIPDGVFTMGSERFYFEEAPLRRVSLDGFWIDRAPVTNRAFAALVEATGHITAAQVAPDPRDYPGMSLEMARAGSLVFREQGPGGHQRSIQLVALRIRRGLARPAWSRY